MIVYHGTTVRRARRICEEGFVPKKPSRRVWFAESRAYALGRAKTQARRSHDRPVVLTCDLDLGYLRHRYGARRVLHRSRVIAVDGPVPVTVLRSHPAIGVDVPTTPDYLAKWVNAVLGLKPHKGVGAHHPGIDRLSRWICNRLQSAPRARVKPRQALEMARRYLPEFFEGFELDPDRAVAYRRVGSIAVRADEHTPEPDPREDEALECLGSEKARRRARGLRLLVTLRDPDLFDWGAMFLDDPSVDVRVAALGAMAKSETGEPEPLLPLASDANKRVRAGALTALAAHDPRSRTRWLERALKDPAPCVRLAAVRQLDRVEPEDHHDVFELALTDPNPDVARAARKLTAGKGYARMKW
jgi:hypothetical protein